MFDELPHSWLKGTVPRDYEVWTVDYNASIDAGQAEAIGLQDVAQEGIAYKKRRAYLIVHPQTCGGRLITQAFVTAGCFGDPGPQVVGVDGTIQNLQGHGQRLDLMQEQNMGYVLAKDDIDQETFAEWFSKTLDDAPDVVVWRRSVPHGQLEPIDSLKFVQHAIGSGYEPIVVVPWRVPCHTQRFKDARGAWGMRWDMFQFVIAWCSRAKLDPFIVNYDAFVLSPEYRRFVGYTLKLPNPMAMEKLTYKHAGHHWGDDRWWKIGKQTNLRIGR